MSIVRHQTINASGNSGRYNRGHFAERFACYHCFKVGVKGASCAKQNSDVEQQSMMVKTKSSGLGIDDLIGDKRRAVLELAEKHGATNVRVFGSVARGEAGPDSDIDLLVEWDMTHISSWGGSRLDIELRQLLGREVDITTESGLHWYIRERVLREAVAL